MSTHPIIEIVYGVVEEWRHDHYDYDGPSELRMGKATIKMLGKVAGAKKPKGGWAQPGSRVLGIPIVVVKGMGLGVVEACSPEPPFTFTVTPVVGTGTEEPFKFQPENLNATTEDSSLLTGTEETE